jgi:drug/metabolite transporter (DMT)-like permease
MVNKIHVTKFGNNTAYLPNKMNPSVKAHVSLFIAQVIYALNYSIAKDLMPNAIKPIGLVMLRIIGALILFWTFSFFIKSEKIEKSDFKKLMILALFGVCINQVFFIYGLSLTKPINSAIIMVSNPIAVMLFTIIVFKERLTIFKIGGLALGIIGALTLLLFKGSFTLGSETITGDLMTLVNSLSWAIFVVMAKPYMIKYQTITVMKWLFLFGFIYMLPFGLPDLIEVNWLHLSSSIIMAMAFVVIGTTFLAYLLNMYALKALSSSVVSMYIYFQPFLATLIAVYLGKDEITPIKIISALCIIFGVFFVSKKNYKL